MWKRLDTRTSENYLGRRSGIPARGLLETKGHWNNERAMAKTKWRWLLLVAALVAPARAEPKEAQSEERATLHFQATVATQAHPSFPASYSGRNSMSPDAESATSVVMDLFAGLRLWSGAEVYFQPELASGRGLSTTLGVAAFPSGEVYRVGNPEPTIIVARALLRQVIGPVTVNAGKFSVTDLFDSVPLSNDPHTRFTSWGLWASAAYDYPADTRGYTWGVAVDLSLGW